MSPIPTPKVPTKKVSDELQDKFDDLEDQTGKIEKIINKNGGYDSSIPSRFRNVPCPAWTELKYTVIVASIDEDGVKNVTKREFPFKVHANRVVLDGMPLILSQAPKEESEPAFWKAVCENSYLILDLTNQNDRNTKGVQRYFPHEIGEQWKKEDQDVRVTCLAEIVDVDGLKKLKRHDYLVEATLRYPNKTEDGNDEVQKQKNVSRLHFRGWPDHGAISLKDLNAIVDHIRSHEKETQGGQPLWIHCTAGMGRSGTLAVALALSKMHEEGKLNSANYAEIIDKLILEGRTQRGLIFVQTSSQYQLLHEFAQLLVA